MPDFDLFNNHLDFLTQRIEDAKYIINENPKIDITTEIERFNTEWMELGIFLPPKQEAQTPFKYGEFILYKALDKTSEAPSKETHDNNLKLKAQLTTEPIELAELFVT